MDNEFCRLLDALHPSVSNADPDRSCTYGPDLRPLHRRQARIC
jgi:hypothetical protein